MTRRALRESIFRVLFRLEFNNAEEMDEQIDLFINTDEDANDEDKCLLGDMSEIDKAYIMDKSKKIVSLTDEIDEIIEMISDGWKISRLGKAELTILRLAIYEMKYDSDVPYKVAINEALELAKIYCNEDAKGFVNALLSKVEE